MTSFALLSLASCSNADGAIQDTFYSDMGVDYTISFDFVSIPLDASSSSAYANLNKSVEFNVTQQYDQSSETTTAKLVPTRGVPSDEIYYCANVDDVGEGNYYSVKEDTSSSLYYPSIHWSTYYFVTRRYGLLPDTLEDAVSEEGEDGSIVLVKTYPHSGSASYSDSAMYFLNQVNNSFLNANYMFKTPSNGMDSDISSATFKMVIKDGLVQSIEFACELANSVATAQLSFKLTVNEVSPSITVEIPDAYKN